MSIIVLIMILYLVFAPLLAIVLSMNIASKQDDEIRDLKKRVEDFISRERKF